MASDTAAASSALVSEEADSKRQTTHQSGEEAAAKAARLADSDAPAEREAAVAKQDAKKHAAAADGGEPLPEDTSMGIPMRQLDLPAGPEGSNYCYLILFNLNKKNNLGTILRSCAAFGVRRVILVGRSGFKSFCKKSGQGAVPIEHSDTLRGAVDMLRAWHPEPGRGVRICGVEILPDAASLHSQPFQSHTAFMVGNERGGLTREQIDVCDDFVYIPQFGAGVGSLNVACACSVVLYQFTVWANSGERVGLGVPAAPLPAMAKPHGAGSFPVPG
eukprot:TRINITY_DN14365_c0_g1_i1.p1 TRINITY_DN14365_c0_g1~~TRINITY_DN14365_c0_g1_i1.p1  ORF type:complete len:275 (-),score=34.38 TRINITY_DN14365_c0_g1_i1:23-847(-)